MLKKAVSILLSVTLGISVFLSSSICASALGESDISAPSAVLMDSETGKILFQKNPHEVRACASITKVMTLILIFEAIDSGKLTYDTVITTSPHAASMGGSDIWLVDGEQMSANDMIKAIVVASANDAAVAMAEYINGSEESFVQKMNEKAKQLGMKETVFKNCNGLDEDGHVTSAYDVAIMSRELMKHKDIFNYTSIWLDYLRDGATQIVNTNKLLKSYNGITGLKTGTTSQAGACISATAQREELHLIAVVLGSPTTTERFDDAAALLDYGFSAYCSVTPEEPKEGLNDIPVKNGMSDSVQVKANINGKFLMEKGNTNEIETQISLKEELEAPVKKDSEVGRVTYKAGETVLGVYPVVACEDIDKINFGAVIGILFNNLIAM